MDLPTNIRPIRARLFKTVAWLGGAAFAGCSAPAGPSAEVHVGDSLAAVQEAMGSPDGKQVLPNTGGHQSIWIYSDVQPKRRKATGWSEVLVPGVHDQNDKIVQQPVTHEVHTQPVKQEFHVIFTDGTVSSIEYQKP